MGVTWVPLASAALTGGAASWAATWLNEKSKSRAYIMGAVDSAVEVALKSATAEIERLNKEVMKLRSENEECFAKNRKMEQELQELKNNIDNLMNEKVPPYAFGPAQSAE